MKDYFVCKCRKLKWFFHLVEELRFDLEKLLGIGNLFAFLMINVECS